MTEDVLDSKLSKNLGIRANAERAKRAQYLVMAVLFVHVAIIVVSNMQLNLLQAMQNREYVTVEMVSSNSLRIVLVFIVYLVVSIISSVTFIMWFRRAYYNLGKRANPMYTDGWAAGAWFIPILSWFRPYQIMKEMWEKTTDLINKKSNKKQQSNNVILLIVWWTMWIVLAFIGYYLNMTAFIEVQTIEKMINSTNTQILINSSSILLSIITIIVIEKYATKEETLLQLEREQAIFEAKNHS